MATAFPYQLTFVGRLYLSFRKKTAFLPPGHSCKEIRNANSHLKDGEYWIAFKKNRSLLKVFCDMTTDGGKEWMFKKLITMTVVLFYFCTNCPSIINGMQYYFAK